jgi:hypothetical protein
MSAPDSATVRGALRAAARSYARAGRTKEASELIAFSAALVGLDDQLVEDWIRVESKAGRHGKAAAIQEVWSWLK